MRLVVGANVLVGQATNARGRRLLAHSDLVLLIAVPVWEEARHEIAKRYERMLPPQRIAASLAGIPDQGRVAAMVAAGQIEDAIRAATDAALDFLAPLVIPVGPVLANPDGTVVAVAGYTNEARRRIPDPDDLPTGALALAADAAIWTNDEHLIGGGLAVWTTERLRVYLDDDAVH